jgi:hypothetical protein
MAPVSATTKLQAVNTMLSCIGEAPVAALPSTRPDAVIAETILDEVTREILSYGWHFNTEIITATPDVNDEILVDATWAKVDLEDSSYYRADYNIVVRDGKLYNTVTNSDTFTSSMQLEVVLFQEYEKIPETARRYIMIRAGRIFQDRVAGAPNLHAFQMQDEIMALASLRDQEATDSDYTIFNGWAAGRTVMRRSVLGTLNTF